MKSIWVFTNEYDPFIIGGLGTVATYLSKALAKSGLNITVITRNPVNKISMVDKGKITILRFPVKYPGMKIAAVLRKKKIDYPDVIHIHSLEYAPLAQYYKKQWKIPHVYTLHSIVTRNSSSEVYRQSRQRRLLESAKTVVVPSKQEYERLVKKYPFCKQKTKVIGHGVVLRKSNKRVRPDRLLYAGRVIHEKGITELIDAMKILKRIRPEVRLYLIGDGDQRYIRKLKLKASKNQLQHHIYWLGYYNQTDLQSAYQQYGAVIMPSKTESFGLVALEALANGVPLVSTKAGGLSMFVSSKVAQVIPKVSGRAIAAAIHKMWKQPQLTQKRVLAGKKLASNYTWSKAAKRYLQIYKI